MNDDVRNIVLGVVAAGISAALGWVARTYQWKRKLRRKQAFFGLPDNSDLEIEMRPSSWGAVTYSASLSDSHSSATGG